MAWLTAADATNLISTVQKHVEWQYAGIIWSPVLQKRTVTTTTNKYVGIAYSSAPGIASTLAVETNVIECYYTEPIGGGCDVVQVKQTDTWWVTGPGVT